MLDVRDLRKTYVIGHGWLGDRREVRAVDGVSFGVRRGETLGIVGESGSGKSTIGKCLLKLVGINGGQLRSTARTSPPCAESRFRPMRKDIQMIFQDPFASIRATPWHHQRWPARQRRTRRRRSRGARELLALVGLEPSAFDRYPISSPAASASAMASRARAGAGLKCWWPTSRYRRWTYRCRPRCWSCCASCNNACASRCSSPDLRAPQICDAVLVMHRGKVVEHGTPSQIFDRPQHAYTKQLIAAVPGQHWDPTQARAQAASAYTTQETHPCNAPRPFAQIDNEFVTVTEFAPQRDWLAHRHGMNYVVVPQTTGLLLETPTAWSPAS